MDYIGILGIIFGGAGLLGTIGGFVYLRPRLRKEDSEADKAKHDAKMADLTVSEKAYQIIDKLQEELQERTKITLDLEKSAHQNSLKLVEHENTIVKLRCDVNKLQQTVDVELRRRRYAEQLICLREDCDTRIPDIGTYVPPIEIIKKDEDTTE